MLKVDNALVGYPVLLLSIGDRETTITSRRDTSASSSCLPPNLPKKTQWNFTKLDLKAYYKRMYLITSLMSIVRRWCWQFDAQSKNETRMQSGQHMLLILRRGETPVKWVFGEGRAYSCVCVVYVMEGGRENWLHEQAAVLNDLIITRYAE